MPASPKTLSADGRRDDLAGELRALRHRSGLTLAALARRTCYSKSSWERYLNGKSLPPEPALRAFAEAVGVSPARLLVLRSLADKDAEPAAEAAEVSATGTPGEPVAAPETMPVAAGTAAARVRPAARARRRAAVPLLFGTLGLVVGILAGLGLSTVLRDGPAARAGAGHESARLAPDAGSPRCVGFECEGKDPERFGCTEKVWTAAMRRTGKTYVELRYSPTCQAAWGRIVHADVGDVAVVEGPQQHTAKRPLSYGHDVYTPMVDAPFPASVRACVRLDGGGQVCTEQGGASPEPYTTPGPTGS